ncbi:MAG: bifunctional riboflavin kinase/FAD synthetase [Planctomycetes bacterium]|nr:bifunctional riboflavin kinase/FAD synthetase [Planctomycetota bacterium]
MTERCITGLDNVPPQAGGGVLTLGNFDGVHLGHQSILASARALGDAEKMPVVVMTFDPPPDLVLRPGDPPRRITLPDRKTALLRDCGADYVVTARTDMAMLAMSPEKFVREILVGHFAPRHIVEGNNFFYGRRRTGDIRTLRDSGVECGFTVHLVESVVADFGDGAVQISSTLIRGMLLAGRIEPAARALGRPFEISGTVVEGMQRGREMNYPTANIDPDQQITPGDGVYAGVAIVDECEYPAAISIGDQPTFGDAGRTIEAFLLDVEGCFYGKAMRLGFRARLRDQARFASPEELIDQMRKDVERVREIVR